MKKTKRADEELDVQYLRIQLNKFGSAYLSEVAEREQLKFKNNSQGYSETIWRLQGFLEMANGHAPVQVRKIKDEP